MNYPFKQRKKEKANLLYIFERAILLSILRRTHLEKPGAREDEWRRKQYILKINKTRTNHP